MKNKVLTIFFILGLVLLCSGVVLYIKANLENHSPRERGTFYRKLTEETGGETRLPKLTVAERAEAKARETIVKKKKFNGIMLICSGLFFIFSSIGLKFIFKK